DVPPVTQKESSVPSPTQPSQSEKTPKDEFHNLSIRERIRLRQQKIDAMKRDDTPSSPSDIKSRLRERLKRRVSTERISETGDEPKKEEEPQFDSKPRSISNTSISSVSSAISTRS